MTSPVVTCGVVVPAADGGGGIEPRALSSRHTTLKNGKIQLRTPAEVDCCCDKDNVFDIDVYISPVTADRRLRPYN